MDKIIDSLLEGIARGEEYEELGEHLTIFGERGKSGLGSSELNQLTSFVKAVRAKGKIKKMTSSEDLAAEAVGDLKAKNILVADMYDVLVSVFNNISNPENIRQEVSAKLNSMDWTEDQRDFLNSALSNQKISVTRKRS